MACVGVVWMCGGGLASGWVRFTTFIALFIVTVTAKYILEVQYYYFFIFIFIFFLCMVFAIVISFSVHLRIYYFCYNYLTPLQYYPLCDWRYLNDTSAHHQRLLSARTPGIGKHHTSILQPQRSTSRGRRVSI